MLARPTPGLMRSRDCLNWELILRFDFPAGFETFWLDNIALPAALTTFETPLREIRPDGLVAAALLIDGGRIARIVAGHAPTDGIPRLAGNGRLVLPRLVDIHTHLDKGHIFARAPNPDGTFMGALTTVLADREANWHAADVRARMEFALKCALHHGTGAVRTHLDCRMQQTAISWAVFDEVRAEWKDRIALQAVSLMPVNVAVEEPDEFSDIVRHVTRYGGILGAVTYLGEKPDARLDAALDRVIETAKVEGFELDFHVDESASPDALSLERIADALLRHRFSGKVLAGHCCSLALMADADRDRVAAKLGEAGVAVVSLPLCNLYLQDRQAGVTPRWRGVAPLHELDAAGITTMVASDNTRDPFYAYGDLDGVEVFREATRVLHLDHSERPWLETLTVRPADHMGLAGKGRIAPGLLADLIIFSARTMNEFFSRPQSDRLVLIGGKPLDAPLPDYAELDDLQGVSTP